jgi:hypothetical protein
MSEKKQRASATSSTKGSTLKDKTKKDTVSLFPILQELCDTMIQ